MIHTAPRADPFFPERRAGFILFSPKFDRGGGLYAIVCLPGMHVVELQKERRYRYRA